MNYVRKIIDLTIAIFSQEMRYALELEQLNKIIVKLVTGKEDILDEVLSHKWHYHKDKVRFFLKYNEESKRWKE